MIIIIIHLIYSAVESEDTEALDMRKRTVKILPVRERIADIS